MHDTKEHKEMMAEKMAIVKKTINGKKKDSKGGPGKMKMLGKKPC